MVTFTSTNGSIEMRDCEFSETHSADTGVLTTITPGGAVVARRKRAGVRSVRNFAIRLLSATARNELITFLDANYGLLLDIVPPGFTITGMLMQEPLQIIQTGRSTYEVEFKVLVQ